MNRILTILLIAVLSTSPYIYSQKGKNKGGGNQKVNIKIKTDEGQVKLKTNKKGDVKIDLKDKGGKDHDGDHGEHHDNGNHYGHYKNKTLWFFGPGDVYMVSGKPKKERIIIFDQVCIRLSTNIEFMFGLLGNIRIKLDTKKATMKPEKHKQLTLEIGLLENDLKLIEIKKKKIKFRLAQLKKEND
jgi:hypothetical protein